MFFFCVPSKNQPCSVEALLHSCTQVLNPYVFFIYSQEKKCIGKVGGKMSEGTVFTVTSVETIK